MKNEKNKQKKPAFSYDFTPHDSTFTRLKKLKK